MDPREPASLLELWDRAAGRPPLERALALLEDRVDAPADLPLGARDRLLLATREALFGPAIETTATCPACGERIALSFSAAEALGAAGDRASDTVAVVLAGRTVRLRLPTSRDVAAVAGLSGARARRALVARLVVGGDDAPDLGDGEIAAAEAALRAAAPDSEILVETACAACGAAGAFLFDPAGHLWAEMDAAARRLLADVHALASVYGWSERAILALPPARRRRYLELVAR